MPIGGDGCIGAAPIGGGAHHLFQRTGIATVIVQDNALIHTSKAVQERLPIWQAQGLDFFQRPPYWPEMNQIETQWHQLKRHF
ncbi:transposase [Nodosilinea sp. E11]|uniref:transposase n=1 Tax=Nodosilinea sp. E11 TaxID=3037479 RepID=UPI00397726AC